MWAELLGRPTTFTLMIQKFGAKGETPPGYRRNIQSMLPEQFDSKVIQLPYLVNQKLLICFTDSTNPFVKEAPIVFEVSVRRENSFLDKTKNGLVTGEVNRMFKIDKVWIPDRPSNSWKDLDKTVPNWRSQVTDIPENERIYDCPKGLKSLLSESSQIWFNLPRRVVDGNYPIDYLPTSWIDIASFVARLSVSHFTFKADTMHHKMYMHSFSSDGSLPSWWQSINRQKVA